MGRKLSKLCIIFNNKYQGKNQTFYFKVAGTVDMIPIQADKTYKNTKFFKAIHYMIYCQVYYRGMV